jgi:lipid II:glycine glycyltransferase (peptidoglycan interpeptide bridge formation enzyme)
VSIEKLKGVYTFIHKQQSLKGYSISMTFEELQKTVDACKENFFLFAAWNQEEIVAASVSIKVTDSVLYNFYITHDATYKQYSPVVAIIETLYNFCKERNLSILDLGTSMLNDKPNISLLDFKRRLGGVDTERLILSKILS